MSGHQSGTGIPSQPARLGGAASGGGGFETDVVQFIAYDPAGGDVERAWRIKDLLDYGGSRIEKVTLTPAIFNAAWDTVSGHPVYLPALGFTVKAGEAIWASGLRVVTAGNDTTDGDVGWYTTGNVLVTLDNGFNTKPLIGQFQGLISGEANAGSWSRSKEPMVALVDSVIYPGISGWAGNGTVGEAVLWAEIRRFGL